MLFIAQDVPKNQSPSQLFKNYGANNLAPAIPSEVSIHSYPNSKTEEINSQRWHMRGAIISSFHSNDDVTVEGHLDAAFNKPVEHANFLFTVPPVVTSFTKPTEETKQKAKECGFVQTSLGRLAFYQGTDNVESMAKIAKAGGDIHSYAPEERVSIAGAMALHGLRRLLFILFHQAEQFCDTKAQQDTISSSPYAKNAFTRAFAPSDIPEDANGHFLPYFPGLTLPDRSTSSDLIELFNQNLGKKETTRKHAVLTISRGWKTIYNTSVGRIITHIMVCVRLAQEGGFMIKPIYTYGEYVGCLLGGPSHIVVGTKDYAPIKGVDLRKEILSMTSHDTSLLTICEILSEQTVRDTEVASLITPDYLETPRALHYACSARKVSPEAQKKITDELPKLRFHQTFWKATDAGHIISALVAISSKVFLDNHAPFILNPSFLFARDIYLSTLAAFGNVAPVLSDTDGHSNMVLRLDKNLLKGTTSQGSLQGIPVFTQPTQQAVEEWKQLKKTGMVHYRVKGKTSFGVAKVANVSRFIPTSDADFGQVFNLAQAFAKRGLKKRSREDEDPTAEGGVGESETSAVKEAKKARRNRESDEQDGMFAAFGFGNADMDVDE